MNSIQNQFEEFCAESQLFSHAADIDYLGIDISGGSTLPVQFKLYYGNSYSQKASHPLIDYLSSKNMIRYVTLVRDLQIPGRGRFDIGLKNRSDDHMESLFAWLSEKVPFYKKAEEEIRKLSQIRVTEREGFRHAGLYFLGMISQEDAIEVLKCHYFLRMCEHPDVLHKNISYMDSVYLEELARSGSKEFALLSECAARLLSVCGGHLWMAGTDYAEGKASKYKIYIKNPMEIYEGLAQVLGRAEYAPELSDFLMEVEKWQSDNPAFSCEGFAVCLTSDGEWSVNFYNVMI
ncbi:MAG: hypothetical protein LUG93_01235 [Lachnospiraceae bacterium]|nr:hypothetical protein [Lachnospiraceae bacterium]